MQEIVIKNTINNGDGEKEVLLSLKVQEDKVSILVGNGWDEVEVDITPNDAIKLANMLSRIVSVASEEVIK